MITFLSETGAFGRNKLDMLWLSNTKCAITDFSILLGGYSVPNDYITDGNKKERVGVWWTKSSDGNGNAEFITSIGSLRKGLISDDTIGARPFMSYRLFSSEFSNLVLRDNGILEAENGEYPQTVVSEEFSQYLEKQYLNNQLKQTGKSYTTNSATNHDGTSSFKPRKHIEYEYNGKKYIRFVGDYGNVGRVLSDGRIVQENMPYWVEVEPIKWMIDRNIDIALSKKIIFSGVQFDNRKNYNNDFGNTEIKKFIDTYFSREMLLQTIEEKNNVATNGRKIM